MKYKEFDYIIDGKKYHVNVKYNGLRQKKTYYRFHDGEFHISAGGFSTFESVKSGLDQFARSLIAKSDENKYFHDGFMFLLGDVQDISGGLFIYNKKKYKFVDEDHFYNSIKKLAKPYFEERVKYFSKLMGVNSTYRIELHKARTRYGSNSISTLTLSFNIILIHYSYDIIDSVIVHELAHHFVRNHSKKFYDVVYKYCPNYDYLHTKLRKGIMSWF